MLITYIKDYSVTISDWFKIIMCQGTGLLVLCCISPDHKIKNYLWMILWNMMFCKFSQFLNFFWHILFVIRVSKIYEDCNSCICSDLITWVLRKKKEKKNIYIVIKKKKKKKKKKKIFFQAVAVSVLLYGCTTWMLTKKLDENYTKMIYCCFE